MQAGGPYIVSVIDGGGSGSVCINPTTGVTISEPPALSILGLCSAINTTCGYDNGEISIALSSGPTGIGGTPPYTTEITSTNATSNITSTVTPYSSIMTNVANLMPGTYTITTIDSGYGIDSSGNTIPLAQTATTTCNIAASISPSITIAPSWYCWRSPDTVNDAFIILTSNISTTYNVSIQSITVQEDNNGSLGPISSNYISGNALATNYVFKPSFYRIKLTDSTGCETTTTIDLRPGNGQVPSIQQKIEYVPENYCWIDGSAAEIKPKFQVWVDGPFEILNGSTIVYSSPSVPHGSYVTLPIQLTSSGTIFTLKETTHNCEVSTLSINLSAQVPTDALTSSISQGGGSPCGTNPSSTSVTCTANGGWSSYTYGWTINGGYAGATQSLTVPLGSCGNSYVCVVMDAEGCIKESNAVIIS